MLDHLNESWFQQDFVCHESKVMPLKEAVEQHVKPGMLVHAAVPGPRWCTAILFEIARQFWNRKGSLRMVALFMNLPQAVLVHGKIVSKIITSYIGDPYYSISPNPVMQRAILREDLEVENWSILTLAHRLQAAAMGLPFFPTNSITGSSMADENRNSFTVMDDPFEKGNKTGLVKALTPDITIIHGWMADEQGNAVFLPPYGENLYGAMASKGGTVLTVEKIVSSDKIREHNHLVRLPGAYVNSVSEVPFGTHPGGLSRVGMKDMDLYAEDYDFINDGHVAAKTDADFEKWIQQWVLSCESHEDYLEKLGNERMAALKGLSHADSWRTEIKTMRSVSKSLAYNDQEMAIVVMARKLKDTILRNRYKTMLCGAGTANLAGWLCFYSLRKKGYEIDLIAEIGLLGFVPKPLDPSLFNLRNFPTCKMTTDTQTILGVLVCGSRSSCIGALGAAEVDISGNINTTKSADGKYIIGSGGSNDVATSASEVITIIGQSKSRFMDRLSYITSPGKNVTTVVSTKGVFGKIGVDDALSLVALYPQKDKSSIRELTDEIQRHCSWKLKKAQEIKILEPPEPLELELIRSFDPHGYYLGH